MRAPSLGPLGEGTSDGDAWLAGLLRDHLARYPSSAPADVYKLLHQAVMGPGHAVTDPASARSRLEAEVAGVAGATIGDVQAGVPAEPMVDALGTGLARVHLRPWVGAGNAVEALCAAFVATAAAWVPDPVALGHDLAQAAALLGRGVAGEVVDPADLARGLEQLAGELAGSGYPAVAHSPGYRRAYRPAYRVVETSRLRV